MDHAQLQDLSLRQLRFVLLVALVFLPLELAFALRRARRTREALAADLAFASAGKVIVRVASVGLLGGVLPWLEDHGLASPLFAFVHDATVRALCDVSAGLLLFELGGYAYHRLAHRVPWLWRMHQVHHSATHMDWLASFRQHPLEVVLLTLAQNAPLALCGIPLGAHASVLVLLELHTVFVHANLHVTAGPLAQLVALPDFHHRHHARDAAPRNFASIFPWLDRLFGTYAADRAARFGVQAAPPEGFFALLALPFRRARGGYSFSSGAAKNASTSSRRASVSL
jgi:sterol desaturase/sphingolipid hydroxylase (fatty acid hydroxylase superfamily)